MPIKLNMRTLPLILGGLAGMAVAAFVVFYILHAWWAMPIIGFGADGPDQPIAFPHTVHVEQAGIQCEFCHRNVTKGESATIPAVEQCLFCHETITGEDNAEIAKLLGFGGLDSTGKRDLSITPQPINWERVHRMPDHVQFAHEPHLRFFSQQGDVIHNADVMGTSVTEATCTICHGQVRNMEKVKQTRSLKMGDCVDCHRDNDAPTDCVTCHY